MPHLAIYTAGDAAHIGAAGVLCPDAPPGWTRALYSHIGAAARAVRLAGGGLLVLPIGADEAALHVQAGTLVVSGHAANAPVRAGAEWRAGLVAVGARSTQGNEPSTSSGPGLWVAVDVAPVLPANAQSWAAYAAAFYLARAWHAHGSAEAAQASLVGAARLASGQASWTESTGYGILPAYVLPEPGALLGTQALAWSLFGDPAGASITPMTLDGRTGVRIVAGVGSSRLRARALDGALYDEGRLYRRRVYMRNLSSTSTPHLVARVSETPFGLAPGEAVEAGVWEMKSSNPATGYDPQWQLRSGLVHDVPGAVLDVFVSDTVVETYEGGALTLPPIVPPDSVAPYAVTATATAPGVYTVAWHTGSDPESECVVSVDGVDVAAGASPQTVYLGAGTYAVRVRLATGETEDHSVVTVVSADAYVPPAPSMEVGRDGDVLVIAWPSVAGAASYRATVAPGVGMDAEVTLEDALSPTLLAWPGAAEVRVYAVGPSGEESPPGVDYAAGSGRARAVPLW